LHEFLCRHYWIANIIMSIGVIVHAIISSRKRITVYEFLHTEPHCLSDYYNYIARFTTTIIIIPLFWTIWRWDVLCCNREYETKRIRQIYPARDTNSYPIELLRSANNPIPTMSLGRNESRRVWNTRYSRWLTYKWFLHLDVLKYGSSEILLVANNNVFFLSSKKKK
jgi:hypothetical protein